MRKVERKNIKKFYAHTFHQCLRSEKQKHIIIIRIYRESGNVFSSGGKTQLEKNQEGL